MKYKLLMFALIAIILTNGSFAQDNAKQTPLPQLLSSYYNIKNALVAGNPVNAASAAVVFIKAASIIDNKVVSEENINALVKDAKNISQAKDITRQREYFTNFSTNMAAVAKTVKLTDQPIYQAYCPMKKASWLSSEKEIKNPYYGNMMLTCGEVTNTIQ